MGGRGSSGKAVGTSAGNAVRFQNEMNSILSIRMGAQYKEPKVREILSKMTYDTQITNPDTGRGFVKDGKIEWNTTGGKRSTQRYSSDVAKTISKWKRVSVTGGI